MRDGEDDNRGIDVSSFCVSVHREESLGIEGVDTKLFALGVLPCKVERLVS